MLEDLFIGLTKNCPASINFIPSIFNGPLEKLETNYFSIFDAGQGDTETTSASNKPFSPIEAYLDSQQTPDKA